MEYKRVISGNYHIQKGVSFRVEKVTTLKGNNKKSKNLLIFPHFSDFSENLSFSPDFPTEISGFSKLKIKFPNFP